MGSVVGGRQCTIAQSQLVQLIYESSCTKKKNLRRIPIPAIGPDRGKPKTGVLKDRGERVSCCSRGEPTRERAVAVRETGSAFGEHLPCQKGQKRT